jgi:hypothetical protein
MATRIVFAASSGDHSLSVDVEQSLGEVHQAFNSAGGLPVQLKKDNGDDVWVNPSLVAYWEEKRSGSASF